MENNMFITLTYPYLEYKLYVGSRRLLSWFGQFFHLMHSIDVLKHASDWITQLHFYVYTVYTRLCENSKLIYFIALWLLSLALNVKDEILIFLRRKSLKDVLMIISLGWWHDSNLNDKTRITNSSVHRQNTLNTHADLCEVRVSITFWELAIRNHFYSS